MYERSRLSQVRNKVHVCFLTQLLPPWKAEICLRPHLAAQRRRLADGGTPTPPTAELLRLLLGGQKSAGLIISAFMQTTHICSQELISMSCRRGPAPPIRPRPRQLQNLEQIHQISLLLLLFTGKNRKHLMVRRSTCTTVRQRAVRGPAAAVPTFTFITFVRLCGPDL